MKNIWLCPKCGSSSKRNANIRRHGLTVHEEGVVPIAYDPLLQRLCLNEQMTYHVQQDAMPYFFPFKNRDKKMSRDTAKTESIESLTNDLNRVADLADVVERLKRLNLLSGVSSPGYNSFTNFPMQNLSLVDNDLIDKPITMCTAYMCPRCGKGIVTPWNGLTAKAVHEGSCQSNIHASNTADSQKIQSMKDTLIKQIISNTQNVYPSKRYVECLVLNDIEVMPFAAKSFNIVELGAVTESHWAMRAYQSEKTEISDKEMKEFITISSANFAIFKAKLNTHPGYYFMQIRS
jgi:predicted RNA-binding Zn-ribbon protein involved in translation (DUF1610 family)